MIIWLLVLILACVFTIAMDISHIRMERIMRVTEVHHVYHIHNNFADMVFPINTRVTVEEDAESRNQGNMQALQ